MRINFSDKFISKFRDGVKKSFEFLENDREILEMGEIYSDGDFFVLENLPNSMNLVDKAFKKLGVVMSEKQRLEARKDGVISGKIAIGYSKDRVYIAPFIKVVMDKKFREICRVRGVPRLIRPYIFLNQNLLKWF